MIKVLQVVSCLAYGGTEAFIMNHYRKIDREKIQYDFAVFIEKDWPYSDEIRKLGGKIFFTGAPSLKQRKSFYNKLKKIVEENGPYTAIHCHINVANAWVLYYAKKLNIPIRISHSHATMGKEGNIITKLYRVFQTHMIKKSANRYLACSKLAGDYLYGKRFFEKYGKIMRNGIETKKFCCVDKTKKEDLLREFKIPSNTKLVLGNITRFEDIKNSLFTIDVFKEILKIEPSTILIMGGADGGLLTQVKNRIKDYGIEDSVRLIGLRNDVNVCLSIIDAYIFPSKFEGLPIALLEAQASGCICFSSTEVSFESNMGLGTIYYYPLEFGSQKWARLIMDVMNKSDDFIIENVYDKFVKNSYDVEVTVKYLSDLYNGK